MRLNKRMRSERHRAGMLKRRVSSVVLCLTVLLALVAPPFITGVQAQTEGAVRLADGMNAREGRVEVYLDGQWGTVCDHDFDLVDADVVCRQLGHGAAQEVRANAAFGEGSGPIQMDAVACQGREDRLTQCAYTDTRFTDCGHSRDVGVVCSATGVVVTPTGLTVVEGQSETYTVKLTSVPTGDVTISPTGTADVTVTQGARGGVFTTTNWNEAQTFTVTATDDTDVEGLENIFITHTASGGGYDSVQTPQVRVSIIDNDAPPGQVTGVEVEAATEALAVSWMAALDVTGYKVQWKSDGQVYHATRERVITSGATTRTDITGLSVGTLYTVRVIATRSGSVDGLPSAEATGTPVASGGTTVGGNVRLVDPNGGKFKGRVEIFYDGQWGTVCDDGFDGQAARVVCNQLGHAGTPQALSGAPFGEGTGPIWLDDVACQGNEGSLADCTHRGWGIQDCGHDEDVGVTCNLVPTFDDGSSARLQMAANTGPDVAVGEPASATDENLDSLTYSLEGTDAASFTVDANGQLRTSTSRVPKSSYELTLNVSDPYGGSDTIEVTIAAGSSPTGVALSVSPGSVAENAGGTPVTVTGILDGAALESDTEVTVSVGATGDAAEEGTDYASVNDFTLTIDAGEILGTATFTLTPTNDPLGEDDEKISVTGTTAASGLSVSPTELTITDDETVSTEVVLSMDPTSVAEDADGTPVAVIGTLDGGARTEATTVTVSVGSTGDAAEEGTDYASVNDFTLTIDAGEILGTATFTLTPTNDPLGEDDEKISVTGTTAASGLSVSGTELTITTDEPVSTEVELTVDPPSVAEDAGDTTFTVTGTLDGGVRTWNTGVLVEVGAAWNAAEEGTDYATVQDFTLAIDAGQTSGTATFTLTPKNDPQGEEDEYVSVTGSSVGYTRVIGTGLRIIDDEPPIAEGTARLVGGMSALEGRVEVYVDGLWGTVCDDGFGLEEALVVCRQLGHAGAQEVRNGAYFGAGSGLINMDDVVCQGTEGRLTECMYARLHNCHHPEDAGVVCSAGSAARVELTVNPTSVAENVGGTPVTVTGTLEDARAEATSVTVSIGAATDTATEGTDYATVNNLTLTIGTGQTSGTATFTLTPDNDTLGEGDETISVTGTTTATGLTVTGTELTITDDDTASTEVELSVSLTSVAEDAAGTSVTVTGTLNGGTRTEATTVTVSVGAATDTATEGTDYTTVDDLTLTIGAEQTSGTATFTLTPDNDTLGEGDEKISVTGTTTATGLTVTGTELTELTITDDETVSTEVELSVSHPSVAEDAAAGTVVTVTGTLNGGARTSDTSVTVSVGATGDEATEGTDYTTVNDLTLTIGAEQTSGTATFTLTPDNDTLGEGDEKISVTGTTTATGLTVTGTELTITDDETVSTEVELSVSHPSVAEDAAAGTVVTVTGTLNGGARTSDTSVTVSVGATGDEATEGTDYVGVDDRTLTISAGETSGTATFTLTPTNDELGEGGETVSVGGTTTATGLTVSGTELTITDDDSASTEVKLSVSPASVAENAAGTAVTVTGILDGVARTEATSVTVSVGAPTDTATEGTDYATVNNFTLTIDAEQASGTATFTLTPRNDTLGEGAEQISVGGTTTAAGLTVTGTELTITDNDTASTEVALSVRPRSVAENAAGTPVTVTGTLNGGSRTSDTRVTVSVGASTDSATEGTDYTTVEDFTLTIDGGQTSGTATFTLTIDGGQTSGTATFTLTPRNDTLGEGAEQISVTGTTTAAGLTVTGTELTITDNDTASTEVALSVRPRTVAENAGGTSVTVTGTLNGAARTEATTVTVSIGAGTDTATDGTDYAAVDNFTLTINAEQTSGTATFTLTPTNDTLGEVDETISVSGTTTATGLTVTGTELMIADDEVAPRQIDLATLGQTVAEKVLDAVTLSIIGTLKGPPRDSATSVTVSVGAAGDAATKGTDYTVVEDFLLTIPAGQTRGTATFTFTPLNDSITEPDEAVSVSGTTAASGIMVTGTTVTIADDDERGVEVSPSTLTVLQDGSSTYTVVLGSEPTGDVTVTPSVGGGSGDVTVSPSRLIFTSSNWDTARTVTVSAAPDAGAGTATIEHAVSGADYGVNGVTANPVEVTVADGSGTDAMSRAWLARFGRTVADQVLDAVEGRLGAAQVAGTELSLAGQRIGNGATRERTAEREAAARLETLGRWLRGEQEDGDGPFGWRPLTGREVLRGSFFTLTGGSAEDGFRGLWGRGAITSLDGREGDLRLDGEVVSALLGADWSRGRGSAGVAVAHSRGEGSYRGRSGDGEVESALTGVYPYGRYELSERLSLWGVAGYGAGTLKLTPDGKAAMETDTALAMVAVGGRGVLVKPSEGGGLELAVKPDVLVVRTTAEAAGGLAASEADVTRLRVGLEGRWRGIGVGGGSLVPGFEIGVRHDGGDAETGFGADVGAGLAWRDPARGIEAELRARGLLTHEDGGFRERGFSGSLAWDSDPDSERGPKLTLIQTVGASATSGMDALLRPDTAAGLTPANDDGLGQRRLEAKLGYGFAVFGGHYTSTPELGFGLSERGRETSLGWRLAGARRGDLSFEVRLEGSRLEATNDDRTPEHRFGLRMTARW